MDAHPPLTRRRVFLHWLPLAATWLMMSSEGPFLAAVIARLPEPKFNLAGYGVAFALALLMESPVIMMMTASSALVRDRDSLRVLRRFSHALCLLATLLMALLVVPPVFDALVRDLVGLGEPVASLAHGACLLLLPWPGAIGYRRFYHGILIRAGRTRTVAFGTILRAAAMLLVALGLAFWGGLPGALVGAASLSAGVVVEALVSRAMVRGKVRELRGTEPAEGSERLTVPAIARFYTPLALTTILMLGINPLVTFFLGRSRLALESLAVMPVVHSLTFLLGSAGLAFQETAVAFLGPRREGYEVLRSFALVLGTGLVTTYVLLGNTPLLALWLGGVAGLGPGLQAVAALPVRILGLMPGLSVLICWQRAVLVADRETSPVTWATFAEVGGIAVALTLGVEVFGWVGATAAAAALLTGRLAANAVLQFSIGRTRVARTR